ncbi:hypothetical protein PV797_12920 [Clostridiaceae bacterium M8S5]|nr:hypothetical protein PV797_12920 [Clostridiaceae bacterium M8S5]
MQNNTSSINDKVIVDIQEIFNCIKNYKYEEAFLLSSMIIERSDSGDQLFHEWVKSLAEFYSCNKKDTAIQLLEKIKPEKIENIIHFRIINTLLSFSIEIGNKTNFLKYYKLLKANMNKLHDDDELHVSITSNFANGFYEFECYEKSLEYCDIAISIAQKNRYFGRPFSISIMIKIVNLFKIGKTIEAKNLKNDFEVFLKITNNKKDIFILNNVLKNMDIID